MLRELQHIIGDLSGYTLFHYLLFSKMISFIDYLLTFGDQAFIFRGAQLSYPFFAKQADYSLGWNHDITPNICLLIDYKIYVRWSNKKNSSSQIETERIR